MAKRERVVTPMFRLSFPYVFKPYKNRPEDEPSYSITMLFPKETDMKPLSALAKNAVTAKWAKDVPKNLRSPFRDGDEKALDYPEMEGMTVVSAKSKMPPGIVDASLQKIINPDELYPGCWCRASITAYAYGGKGTPYRPGVAFGLVNIQKVKEDDPLWVRIDPSEEFEALEAPAKGNDASDLFAGFGGPVSGNDDKTDDDIPF